MHTGLIFDFYFILIQVVQTVSKSTSQLRFTVNHLLSLLKDTVFVDNEHFTSHTNKHKFWY